MNHKNWNNAAHFQTLLDIHGVAGKVTYVAYVNMSVR